MRPIFRFAGLLLAILCINSAIASGAFAAGPSIIVDVKTGRVLEHKDAFQKWYPASLTKLMTAYVVFKQVQAGKLELKAPITVSKKAAKAPPSKMYFKPGSQLTLDNALKIILVKSANDVSVAIAESVSGSQQQFVEMMNQQAASLGMSDTRFVNANGLPGKGQSTTARDMALLGLALHREFPHHMHYFALEAIKTSKKTYANYNLLIGRFQGANGMKTGFICSSGFNQVSSATRRGRTIVTVVLGAKSQEERAEESAKLLQLGFATSNKSKPSLYSLRPYGKDRAKVADIRSSICTAEARKQRSAGRDSNGRMTLESAYISPLKRDAHAVKVGLSGRIPAALAGGSIPVPTPRPNVISSGGPSLATTGLKPTLNVPVPTDRPSL